MVNDVEQKELAAENETLHWHPNAIADPVKCSDPLPVTSQPCNRVSCPGTWKEKTWTKVNTVIINQI